jgi:hypothetical protein
MIFNKMRNNSGLILTDKKRKNRRLFNEKIALGIFSIIFLVLANFCAVFFNTAQAESAVKITAPTVTPGDDTVTGCPVGYTALGGIITTAASAGVINNRVVVFARGTDGAVYAQFSIGNSLTFSGWGNLGGGTNSAPMTTVIGNNLYVEVIGTDGKHYYRSTNSGGTYTDWTEGTVGATVNPTAVLGGTGYNFVSGLGGSQPNLCVLITSSATPTPTVTPVPTATPSGNAVTGCPVGYTALGGVVSFAPTASVINNRVVVFARGTDGSIYFQFSSNNTFSGWNGLGGGTNVAPRSIVIGTTLYVEVTGTDGNNYYKSSTSGVGFSDWTKGSVGATTNSSAVLGTTGYNFVNGLSGSQPNLCVLVNPSAAPTPTPTMTPTPTPTPTPTATPTATPTPPTGNAVTGCPTNYTALGGVVASVPTTGIINNRVVVFAKGTDNAIYVKTSNNTSFSDWVSLGGGTGGNPKSIVINSVLYVEIVGTDSKNYYRSTNDGINFSNWTEGTVNAVTTPSATLGTTNYNFVSGLGGSQPNLCVLITPGANPTPTPTVPNPVTGCAPDFVSLGGFITSNPTTSVFGNRVYVFAVGTDGALYSKNSTGGTTFSEWVNLAGGTTGNPKSLANGTNLYLEVVGTDSNNYYKSSTDGTTFSQWTQGTVNAQTNASSVLNGRTYTFAKGSGSASNLCLKIQ